MRNRLFRQVLAVVVAGMVVFSFVVSVFWSHVVDARFNSALDDITSGLAVLLLPEDAGAADVQRIADALSVNLTVYDAAGQLIAASADPVPMSMSPTPQWQEMIDGTHWIVRLVDGRVVIADVTLLGLGNDTAAVAAIFGLLILAVAVLMYPLIRRITRRLERLQSEVEKVGYGNLSQRVTVEGDDEIAKLATSFNTSAKTILDLLGRQRMLLANASHELRTPLARIRMGLELLETKDTPERRDDLRRDIGELDALIDDLITMTRFDTGADKSSFVPVDLQALAAEEAKRIPDCAAEGASGYVLGDARMLQLLIRNLLDNAQKYGHPPVSVLVEPRDQCVLFSVIDQGQGIPASEQEKAFEPFFRGAGQQNVQGSGLGLALVARIAKAHGAEIRVSASPISKIQLTFKSL